MKVKKYGSKDKDVDICIKDLKEKLFKYINKWGRI